MGKIVDYVASVLLVVGGLNWMFVEFFKFNLVSVLFGGTVLVPVTYGLVGLSAIWYGLRLLGVTKGCCK